MFGISLKRRRARGLAALYVVESLVVGDEVGQVDGLAGGGDGPSGCGGIESHCVRARDSLSGVRTRTPPGQRDSLLVRVRGRAERETERERRSCSTSRFDSPPAEQISRASRAERTSDPLPCSAGTTLGPARISDRMLTTLSSPLLVVVSLSHVRDHSRSEYDRGVSFPSLSPVLAESSQSEPRAGFLLVQPLHLPPGLV